MQKTTQSRRFCTYLSRRYSDNGFVSIAEAKFETAIKDCAIESNTDLAVAAAFLTETREGFSRT